MNKMSILQLIHYGAFYLREVKFYPAVLQPQIDRFKTFQCREINGINCRTYQDKMLDIRVICHSIVNGVFEETGIREVKTCINSYMKVCRDL